ncbi:MAG: hypothetical protein JXR94_17030 [Candidatus Hydrogenedentes bacterium]|nr:hypothetical protein [Candidatus Hydrogenedentota bacterium]
MAERTRLLLLVGVLVVVVALGSLAVLQDAPTAPEAGPSARAAVGYARPDAPVLARRGVERFHTTDIAAR